MGNDYPVRFVLGQTAPKFEALTVGHLQGLPQPGDLLAVGLLLL
ncbi:hypothetical protein ACFYW8_34230 [Streptomyces sp. NPDC002742]